MKSAAFLVAALLALPLVLSEAAFGRVEGDSSWRPEVADPSKFELLRTFGPSHSNSVSPAGTYFALYSGNNISLVDVRRGAEARVLAGHNANIHDSGWSRDGRYYATSSYDKSVCVWEVATGRKVQTVPLHSGYA